MSTHDNGDDDGRQGGPQPTFGERFSRFIGTVTRDPGARADLEMTRVLDELKAMGAEPIEDLTPAEARRQPTPADAVRSLAAKAGLEIPDDGVTAHDISYPGAEGDVAARVYRPAGAEGGLPVVLYFHGGGWVYGALDAYDAGPRAIAARTGAVVVSAHYRQAPEHKFPAAHDDAFEAYRWVLEEWETLGGDPARIAVMGESAGANLAINVAIAARDAQLPAPVHMALVYPVAGVDLATPSYVINEHARPLNKAMMGWLLGHILPDAQSASDPRLDLVGAARLDDLPSTTLLTAEIDPLRSEGQALGAKLRAAGVAVNAIDFEGVTHGFFGMAAVVRDARHAQEAVSRDLKAAFDAHERDARAARAF